MNTKEYILTKLVENHDNYLSGETIASELGVTRTAVWKAIRELASDGIEIIALRNQGYRLTEASRVRGMNLLLGAERVSGYLKNKLPVKVWRTLDSTNNAARELASKQANEKNDALIVSATQTAGKGRMGRSFYSPEGCGLYVTLLVHPECDAAESVKLTCAAAVAAARAIDSLRGENPTAEIKWVNDIYLGGKKVAGILTEGQLSIESGRLEFAVVGIGFNLLVPDGGYPEEIRQRAGAIFEDSASMPFDVYNRLAAQFANEYYRIYPGLNPETFLDEYRSRSFIIGRTVTVFRGNDSWDAEVVAINDDFSLSVRSADGKIERLSSGEVTLKV